MASPAKLPVAAMPMKDLIPRGKIATPAKLPVAEMLMKMGARPSMDSRGQLAQSAQQETGVREHKGGGSPVKDIEEHDDEELSLGKDKMDETPMPHAPARCGMQVAIQDMLEHALVAGKWAGLGVMRKANKICVKVSELSPDCWVKTTKGWFQGQLIHRYIMCEDLLWSWRSPLWPVYAQQEDMQGSCCGK